MTFTKHPCNKRLSQTWASTCDLLPRVEGLNSEDSLVHDYFHEIPQPHRPPSVPDVAHQERAAKSEGRHLPAAP
ncbi:hypothetical protein J1605_006180 [Eschrichtius robustus]|uniref:Uncharacterized protein n=1 Tax=Eschrichtius robustus TaxID=9764 RepID=A0AB34H4V3_ESCRO|nr:hypothetical protein J1605_006180 [Eschrichtius robustus]